MEGTQDPQRYQSIQQVSVRIHSNLNHMDGAKRRLPELRVKESKKVKPKEIPR